MALNHFRMETGSLSSNSSSIARRENPEETFLDNRSYRVVE